MSLNDLFIQILQSEQKAKERKTQLNEVKTEIANVQESLKEVQEECILTQGQLVVKIQHQVEAELSLTWLRNKEAILTGQLAQVTKDRESSDQELHILQARQAQDHEEFMQEISRFNQSYDLCGSGREQREAEARQRITDLKQQEQHLLEELSDYRKTQSIRSRLRAEKANLEAEIEGLQMTLGGLQKQLEEKQAVTKHLELAKDDIAHLPQTDPEFVRLRGKLDACHDEALEAMCHALQQEFDRLQRQRWQEQLQRQSNQAAGAAPVPNTSGSTGGVQTESRNSRTRKAQKKQVHPNTLPFSDQRDAVNTWSSFHVTHSVEQTGPCPDASTSINHQVSARPTRQRDSNPPVSSTVTKSTAAVCVKKEPPLASGGCDRPNLAKLRRGIESFTEKPSEGPAPRQFHFRQMSTHDRQGSVPTALPHRASTSEASNTGMDVEQSEMTTSNGQSQVPGNAKRVRFRY